MTTSLYGFPNAIKLMVFSSGVVAMTMKLMMNKLDKMMIKGMLTFILKNLLSIKTNNMMTAISARVSGTKTGNSKSAGRDESLTPPKNKAIEDRKQNKKKMRLRKSL